MADSGIEMDGFFEEAMAGGRVHTFSENGNYIVYEVKGSEIIPFWSSLARMEAIRSEIPKYAKFGIQTLELPAFLSEMLSRMDEEGILVGLNWTGNRLTGFNAEPEEVKRNFESRMR
jgi:hypothetical protein